MNTNPLILPEKFHFLDVKPAGQSVLSVKNKIFQRKWDGAAAEIFIGYDILGDIRIFGRGVLQYGIVSEYTKKFPEIVKSLKELGIPKKTDFVAELIVIDPKTGFENLELIQSRTQRDNNIEHYSKIYTALLIILDVVEVEGKDVTKLNYLDRTNMLKCSCSIKNCNWKSGNIRFIENLYELDWNFIEKNKLEGVVVRDTDATYNKGIWKIKMIKTEDVYCKGEYNPSESLKMEGKELFASLICYQLTKDGKEIYVADVGGGFTEEKRKEIQEILNKGIINKDNPLVIEINTFGRVNSSLKFRSPTFLRIRYDKPWSQCVIN